MAWNSDARQKYEDKKAYGCAASMEHYWFRLAANLEA